MTLAAVAEHGSFTRAAEALGVSQPSVSQQVRELERTAGLPIVQHTGRSLVLTPVGKELAEIGRRITVDRALAERIARRHCEGTEGELMVGASLTTGAHLLPRVLARLLQKRPDALVELRVGNTHDVAQMVVDDMVDVGVVEGDLDRPELLVTAFATDRLTAIAHPRHPLSGRPLRADDVRDEVLLVREDGSGTRQAVLRALASQGFHFRRTLLFGTNETIASAAANGIGIAWLSRIAVDSQLAAGELCELQFSTPPIERSFSVVRRRDAAPTPLGEAFIAALIDS
jgi:LysR family transcriptional regulator, transcriptional activator of the cysJI operon